MQIKIWHGKNHDDATVTELSVGDLHRWLAVVKADGGFFSGSHATKDFIFVPWHRINYVEQVEEEKPEEPDAPKERKKQKGNW